MTPRSGGPLGVLEDGSDLVMSCAEHSKARVLSRDPAEGSEPPVARYVHLRFPRFAEALGSRVEVGRDDAK